MNYFAEEMETLPINELRQLQLERLQATIVRVYKNVNFYHKLFETNKINPENIDSIDDFQKIVPFTTKEDLRENYPYDMFALPLREVVRIHSTLGTTGKPNVVGFTKNDLNHWSKVSARMLSLAGITRDDVIQISFDFGMFSSGFGITQGAELIGASVIPVSIDDLEKQVMIMKNYKSTVLIGTPSYALQLIEAIKATNINPNSLSLKVGLFGNEPWSENVRQKIEKNLFIKSYDIYGLSEIMGLGVAAECDHREGLHIWEDHFLVEVINPDTLEPVNDGEEGELILTSLRKEAIPLIRYRTEDIVSINREKCQCGRTHVRMSRVKGRTDDLIIVQGRRVYPSQIEHILHEIEHVHPHFQIVLDRIDGKSVMEINVVMLEDFFVDGFRDLLKMQKKIAENINKAFGLTVQVKFVEPKSLQSSDGISKKIIDKRN